jgi:diguanylate cyclase (GGDEF)-like protein
VRGMRTLGLSLMVTGLGPKGSGSDILVANCLRRAIIARELASLIDSKDADHCFTSGLLLDSGLLASAKQDMARASYIAGTPAPHRIVQERVAGFVPHPQLGAEIAHKHGLGDEFVQALEHHHDPVAPKGILEHVAWVAERCAGVFEGGDLSHNRQLACQAAATLNISADALDTLLRRVPAQVKELGSALDHPVGDQFAIDELNTRAHESLVMLNEQYEGLVHSLEELLQRKQALEQELRAANERLERLASTDELTGLANRRAIDQALRRDLARADRDASSLSVVMLDIDHFKSVNDTWGHITGDVVLATVGQMLMQSLRASDVAGRWGGEEFLCILPNTDSKGACVLAERLRAQLPRHVVPGPRGPLHVTASFGVATVRGPGCRDATETLTRRADSALYSAKEQGRDRVVVAA